MAGLPDIEVTVAEAQQALAESILTELQLGLTFLDVAETTRDHKHALRSVENAITALRTADRFLSTVPPETVDLDVLRESRRQLSQRLRTTKVLTPDEVDRLTAKDDLPQAGD